MDWIAFFCISVMQSYKQTQNDYKSWKKRNSNKSEWNSQLITADESNFINPNLMMWCISEIRTAYHIAHDMALIIICMHMYKSTNRLLFITRSWMLSNVPRKLERIEQHLIIRMWELLLEIASDIANRMHGQNVNCSYFIYSYADINMCVKTPET